MGNKNTSPIVLVFAGPNGSGKTTITRRLKPAGTYINADDLKAEYALTDLEAAEMADSFRNALLNNHRNFTFETVLSTNRNLHLLQKAKEQGYKVHCIYVLTCDENINVARVKSRYAAGGHDVPEDKIRKRYHRALDLIPELIKICDNIIIYDNSEIPTPIFEKTDADATIYPNNYWSEADIIKLLED